MMVMLAICDYDEALATKQALLGLGGLIMSRLFISSAFYFHKVRIVDGVIYIGSRIHKSILFVKIISS